jgi:cyanate permease
MIIELTILCFLFSLPPGFTVLGPVVEEISDDVHGSGDADGVIVTHLSKNTHCQSTEGMTEK